MSNKIPHPTINDFVQWRKEAEELFKKRSDLDDIPPSLILFASDFFGRGYMSSKAQQWRIDHAVAEFSKELEQDLSN
jgi:hypothetical protein